MGRCVGEFEGGRGRTRSVPRAVGTRYDKLTSSSLAFVNLAIIRRDLRMFGPDDPSDRTSCPLAEVVQAFPERCFRAAHPTHPSIESSAPSGRDLKRFLDTAV